MRYFPKKYVLFAVLCLTCTFGSAFAQEQRPLSVGVYAAYNLNIHDAKFAYTPDATYLNAQDAPYGVQHSHGVALGAAAEYRLSEMFRLNLRGGFASQASDFLRYEAFGPVGIADGTSAEGLSRHRFRQTTKAITIEPGVSVQIIKDIVPLALSVGCKADFFIEKKYEYAEELVLPTVVGFSDGVGVDRRVRNVQSGTIPVVYTPLFSLYGGVETRFTVVGIDIVPSVRYYFPLTSITALEYWRISTLQAGFAVMF